LIFKLTDSLMAGDLTCNRLMAKHEGGSIMKSVLFVACSFALPALSWAAAVPSHATASSPAVAPSSCPAATSIVNVGGAGVYTVPNTAWVGIPASNNHNGAVLRFKEAVIFPGEGQLGRCTYALTQGQVDMRYVPEGPLGGVTATGEFWKNVTGPFGVLTQVCSAPGAEKCTFHVDEPRRM
jgi:hypothetical protein